ncbi:MAG: hypothetical protein WC482_04485 [Candidatus Omnitrophota bacterium]|nr:hypothetical protein [Candidatus Omnitrophota bacterium]
MKTILSICVASLIISVSAVPAACNGDSLVDNMKTLDGHVVSVNIQDSSVTINASEDMKFSVSPGANITNADGFNMQLSDVKTGSYVTVSYYNDRSGKHILTGMEVEYKN